MFSSMDPRLWTLCVFVSAVALSQGCPVGYFGEDCLQQCSPRCEGMACHNVTGACERDCDDGWMLPNCTAQCPEGTYGNDCSRSCSENCMVEKACHANNGTCYDGCKPGYFGHRCFNPDNDPAPTSVLVAVCSKGYYGQGCQKRCSKNCKKGECHPKSGHCTNGCKEDFWGSDCTLFGNFKEAPMETQEKFYGHLSAESKSVLLYVLMTEYENTLSRAQEEISRGVRQRNELRRLIG